MKIRFDPVGQMFRNNLNTLQSARVDALQDTTDVQVLACSLIEHEALRIERKLGKQHPRALDLRARAASNMALIESLQVEREIIQIKTPEVAEQDALVQGRVMDENARGFDGLTICLIDKEDRPASNLKPGTTGVSGHYAIALDQDLASAIAEKQCPSLFLGIFSPRNRLLYKTKRSLSIKPGVRITEDVTLDRKSLSVLSGPIKPRPKPEPNMVAVPDLINLTEADALEKIKSAGLKLGDCNTQIAVDQVGRVLEQNPDAGTKVEPESAVDILVGVAREVAVPELIGRPLREATKILQRSNLTVGQVTGRSDNRHEIVLEQKPKKGEEVTAGTAIDLVIGTAERVKVPNVVGLGLNKAKNDIKRRKLSPGSVSQRTARKAGIVLEQNPLADTEVEKETAVNLIVGKKGPLSKDDIIELMQKDAAFPNIGVSAQKLHDWFDVHAIDSMDKLAKLMDKPDQEVCDDFRLKNLKAAEVFKGILGRLLDNE